MCVITFVMWLQSLLLERLSRETLDNMSAWWWSSVMSRRQLNVSVSEPRLRPQVLPTSTELPTFLPILRCTVIEGVLVNEGVGQCTVL